MTEPLTSENISTKLERIAKLAKEAPDRAFRSLAHYIDIDWLREAYRRTRKDGAVGVDGQTASEYEAHLEENLRALLDRAKSGTYRAPPVRRVYIPKGSGKELRPLGIPTFEDKVLQRAVAMVLGAVYEQDFLDCSHGFRRGRSVHGALGKLSRDVMQRDAVWVLEIDIRKFFDTLDHEHLIEILRRRVHDGVLLRLIRKWLSAGVQEDGSISYPDAGTPQGGVISPLLANVFLHEVLDVWFEQVVVPRMRRPARLVRYADDAVMVFGCEEDARRVMNVLPKRFGKYGLTLHPDKTRLIDFRRPGRRPPDGDAPTRQRTFDFLGFTLHWAKSLKGGWIVRLQIAKDRFRRALKRVTIWCKVHRHDEMKEQHKKLRQKLRGHYEFYGVSGNWRGLNRFLRGVERAWRKWLNRRSYHAGMTWARMRELLKRYPLPQPRIKHYPLRLRAANP